MEEEVQDGYNETKQLNNHPSGAQVSPPFSCTGTNTSLAFFIGPTSLSTESDSYLVASYM